MEPPKNFDVTPPGKTPAGASGRPVLVNHGPILRDPMMAQRPINQLTPQTQTPAPGTQPSDELKIATSSLRNVVVPSGRLTPDQVPTTPAQVSQSDPAAIDRQNPTPQESIAKREHVDKLIDDKSYYVRTGATPHTKIVWLVLVIIVVLAAAVAGYMLL